MGPALIRMLPQFIIYEGSQIESMGQQTGRKPWNPIGIGKVSRGRVFQEKDVTKRILWMIYLFIYWKYWVGVRHLLIRMITEI